MELSQDRLDQLFDALVYDVDGEKLGTVGQIYLDDLSDLPSFLTVRTGLFRTHETFVPTHGLALTDGRVTVPWSAEQIRSAPEIDTEGHLRHADQQRLFAHYGVSPEQVAGETDSPLAIPPTSDADVTAPANPGRIDVNLDRTLPPLPYDSLPPVPSFQLTSDDLTDGAPLGEHLVAPSLGGSARSPQLSWSGAPDATASFAVTCYDPDAPTISGFWHWMVVNLPAELTSLPAGVGLDALPEGAVVIRNDAGEHGFYGAEPPPNDLPHRYLFSVHALSVDSLPVDEGASPAYAAFTFVPATIARATLTGTFAHDGSTSAG